jgi:hypothetical protein
MNLLERVRAAIVEHTVQAAVAAVVILLGWIGALISPVLLPIIESTLSQRLLLSLLMLSVFINLFLLWLLYMATRQNKLTLRWGIYWDKSKNPHCPVCQKPIRPGRYVAAANEFGYFCSHCNEIYHTTDAEGNAVTPAKVMAEL